MWPGPYGDLGSRKYMLASLDQSLQRMGLEYVDIFYHHRPDPDTPMEESLGALDTAVRSGRALYAGISAYNAEQTAEAVKILRALGTPCLMHQPKYSMFVREPEQGLLDVLGNEGVGCIAFSPLAQGLPWVLHDPRVTSALVGTSRVSQVDDNVAALKNLNFSSEELRKIDGILAGAHSS